MKNFLIENYPNEKSVLLFITSIMIRLELNRNFTSNSSEIQKKKTEKLKNEKRRRKKEKSFRFFKLLRKRNNTHSLT